LKFPGTYKQRGTVKIEGKTDAKGNNRTGTTFFEGLPRGMRGKAIESEGNDIMECRRVLAELLAEGKTLWQVRGGGSIRWAKGENEKALSSGNARV